MGSTNKYERELERCIDAMIDEMNEKYCVEMAEEAMIDAKLADIKLREDLINQINEELRCRKISEKAMNSQLMPLVYEMKVRISSGKPLLCIKPQHSNEFRVVFFFLFLFYFYILTS